MITLRTVLLSLDNFDWKDFVYIANKTAITVECACMVLNPDDTNLAEDGFEPQQAVDQGMIEFLSVQDLRSIVDNLAFQTKNSDLSQLLSAVIYYAENDAYMSLSSSK